MKIKYFSASKVHGHYDFDLPFRPDLNFLVGINGTGKTSALRLLQASLTLDIGVLASISFSIIRLEIIDGRKNHSLRIKNSKGVLSFRLNDIDADIAISVLGDDEISMYQAQGRFADYMEEQRLRLLRESGGDFRAFVGISRPLFLGLERRLGRNEDEFNEVLENENLYRARRVKVSSREFVEGIDNCQILIEKAYVKFRRFSDVKYSRLIRFIVTSLFEYVDFEPSNWKENQFNRIKLEQLFGRRHELEKFARDLTGQENNPQVSKFFDRVSQVLNVKSTSAEEKMYVEMLLNQGQLQRIFRIIEEIDSQKKESDKHYEPIREWIDLINNFISKSGKTVDVDSVGRIKILHKGVNVNIEKLSSGEKQLIILLTHARFSRGSGGVIIVDEPELSLHLHWQDILVDSLISKQKDNQFIFATHSPEIVGFRKEYCIQMG